MAETNGVATPSGAPDGKKVSLPSIEGSKKKKHSMVYSEREQSVLKELFALVFSSSDVMNEFGNMLESENADQQYNSTVNMSIATGLSFQLTREFMAKEFRDNSINVNAVMRGTSAASKIMKSYLNTIGGPYLRKVFGELIKTITTQSSRISYELDITKVENKNELNRHVELFLDKMKEIANHITDPKTIDAMPPEIRIISCYIAEISREFVPQNNVGALVGGFLLLRYFNPALYSPEAYGLLPEGKSLRPVGRRNLVLISKVLQNLSNGLEFGKKEQYMMVANPFIIANKERMEKYFQDVVSFVPPEKGTALYAPDPKAVTQDDFHMIHRFFTKNSEKIMSLLKSKDESSNFTMLMDKIGSYQSKASFSFLSNTDKKSVQNVMDASGDEPLYVGWVDKRRRNKIQKRLLVVSHHRIMTIKPGGKLARDGHMLDLTEINSPKPNDVEIKFKGFNILFITEDGDAIINVIRRCYNENFRSHPDLLRVKFSIEPPSRLAHDMTSAGLCGGYVDTYKSLCNYYQTTAHPDVCWHFTHLPPEVTTFDLKRFTKAYSEQPLDTFGLGSLFFALRFNPYFTAFSLKNYKLDKDSFLDFVQTMKCNRKIQELVLSGVGGTSSLFSALFEAMSAHPFCSVDSIQIAENNVEDKGATSLSVYVKNGKYHIRKLDVSSCNIGKTGFTSLFKEFSERKKKDGCNLINLNLAENVKLGTATEGLVQMLEQCGSNLVDLNLRNTGINISQVLPVVSKGCPNLQSLNLSLNRIKVINVPELCVFLRESKQLCELDLSSCKIPQESVKDILTAPKDLELAFNLSDNSFGFQAANLISTLAFTMTSVTSLDLSDNELGDEGIAAIADGLCASTTLKSLSLNRCWNGKSKPLAIENLGKLISTNQVLEAISIVGTKAQPLKTDIHPFLYAIGTNSSITQLDISGHQMGNRGIIILAKSLLRNQTLGQLDWDDNASGALGFSSMEISMLTNQTIKNMQLPIFDIASALKNEPTASKDVLDALSSIEQSLVRNQLAVDQ
eukprot:TRINITY_DN3636_c0_g1_i1.p1 TRINITY_DN3636_c0_g1~~TRINITY_DN3636_c0_g1_i1.p1  ORF type:complete len:1020 (-),score=389.37 TRINITY_DN3636_c0_g1_i1:53-3112(-)